MFDAIDKLNQTLEFDMLQKLNIDSSLKAISDAEVAEIKDQNSKGIEVSVIIPCYNAESFIQPCLESLSAQTLPQNLFEVICVDDLSTDNTLQEIEKFRTKIGNLTVLSHEKNRKQGAARNTGLDRARGKYVFFIDSDDFIRMDALEKLLFQTRKEFDVVVSQLLKVRYDKPYTPRPANRNVRESVLKSALKNDIGWFPVGMLIRRSLIDENEIRFKEGVYFEDIEFCTRVFMKCKSCKVVRDYLYYYIQRDASTVNSMTEKKISDSVAAMKSVLEMIREDEEKLKYFIPTATSWLRLQAARARDSNLSLVEKRALVACLERELYRENLVPFLSQEATEELLKIPLGTPKEKIEPASVGQKTCNSPWGEDLEAEFSDKIVFFCEVDYHIRSAVPVIRELSALGVNCVLVDASRSTSFSTNRPISEGEKLQYSDVDIRQFNVADRRPFSTRALAFVFPNDLTYTSALIFENFGFGVPTFGFYEGINDDLNLDRASERMPYRSVDHLLLPGIYQSSFYSDRRSTIVGLPNIRHILQKDYTPPECRRAVINVNFTYGVLEENRDMFVESAVSACEKSGLDYVISQHPADKGDLSKYNVSDKSIYNLIDKSSILISRFSTTILEALAAGRPVVYHNPIDERVPKFTNALGAYSISNDATSLSKAIDFELKFVDLGGSIRDRSSLFLHTHCSPFGPIDPSKRVALAIIDVLKEKKVKLSFKHGRGTYETFEAAINDAEMKHEKGSTVAAANTVISHSDLLISVASDLLIDPSTVLQELKTGSLKGSIDAAMVNLGSNDPAYIHFKKIHDYALSKLSV